MQFIKCGPRGGGGCQSNAKEGKAKTKKRKETLESKGDMLILGKEHTPDKRGNDVARRLNLGQSTGQLGNRAGTRSAGIGPMREGPTF